MDELLERLDQWAGFSLGSRSVIRRRMAYGAWLLFFASLLMPTLYSGPVLTAEASVIPGFVIWIASFAGFIDLFHMIQALFSASEQWSPDVSVALLSTQLVMHAIGNFLLLGAAWIRLEDRVSRSILYIYTLLAMSIVINPVYYEVRQDLLIGYYLWVAAHIVLTISTFV